jgi:HlyD family secretion protein
VHAQHTDADRNFNRIAALMKENLASEAEYDSAYAQVESEKAAEISAEAQFKSAMINLNYATIRAPIDGVVISRSVDVGQTVAASFSAPTLFTIANDLTRMQVLASVDESDIGWIKRGQAVTFTVDAFADETFSGTVGEVRLDAAIVANVVNYTVVIDVPNNDKKLMPGMTATVSILVDKKMDILKVPSTDLKFLPPPTLIHAVKSTAGAGSPDTVERMLESASTGAAIDQVTARRMLQKHLGRVWIVGEDRKLVPIVVHTGLTDGTFTEITSDKITDGTEIVSGVSRKRSTL